MEPFDLRARFRVREMYQKFSRQNREGISAVAQMMYVLDLVLAVAYEALVVGWCVSILRDHNVRLVPVASRWLRPKPFMGLNGVKLAPIAFSISFSNSA